jgi:hypothetical protein
VAGIIIHDPATGAALGSNTADTRKLMIMRGSS